MKTLLVLSAIGLLAITTATADDFTEKVLQSQDVAIALFPNLLQENSALYKAVATRIEDAKESKPDAFKNPQWPLLLAVTEASKLDISPALPSADPADKMRREIAWALEVPESQTVEEAQRRHAILSKHGGYTPEGRARLTTIAAGGSISEAESAAQTELLRQQASELRSQSDTLDGIYRMQRDKLFFNYPN